MNRILLSLALALLSLPVFAAEPVKVSYYKDVRPIFQQHCQGCHQPAKSLGGYVMTAYPDLFKKGDSEQPGVVASKPADSLLVKLLGEVQGRARMPKGKEPLPEPQVKLITKWVEEGAIDDTPASAKAPLVDAAHPPVYEALPVVSALAFSPNGQLLAVSGYHEVILRSADGSKLVARLVGLSERVQSLAFSPDGKWLAVSGGDPGRFGEVQIWDVEKTALKISIPVSYDTVYGVSWSPDSKLVACGCADNTIRAFEALSGKQILFQGAHADWVMGTSFSQDGQHLVTVSRDRSVKLTEVPTNRFVDNVTSITPGALKGGLLAVEVRPVPPLAKDAKPKMAVVPKDTPGVPAKLYDELLVAGADGQPRLYKMHREVKRVIGDDSNKVRDYEKLPGRIYGVAFNKTGSAFVVGSSLDGVGEARVYETESGKRVATCEGVKTPVYAVTFSPDGKTVVTGGFDGIIRFNDAATGKMISEVVPVPLKK
ncbi:c-type cytochrome domain-containing protein [Zavarzinella formosa]|uniref:c-type cytochrome domain-containing protein n=1 Tax=Zavarzinella formosa TaxID=360055 RepID=UPI00031ED143|nr:c-type cytochrome domain-containing protein [Zavarzinella formosa]